MNAPNHELVSVTKNGTPGMNGENVGLTGICTLKKKGGGGVREKTILSQTV
jgi:hypothetical protein